MIERFNFYDVYGYFIPGIVVLLTLGLPFALGFHLAIEGGEWTALVIGVLTAYLVGHVLQTMASTAIPSSANRSREKHLYPSAAIVSADDSTLTTAVKQRIEAVVRGWFGLEIQVDKMATKDLGTVRQDAFELARRVVVASGNYAEQFQGLYVMMRGITAALWLAFFYNAGWALAAVPSDKMRAAALILLCIGLLGFLALSIQHIRNLAPLKRLNISRLSLFSLGLALFAAGYLLGIKSNVRNDAFIFLVIGVTYIAISLRTMSSTQIFAREFAKAVWVQFAAQPVERVQTK
jgi:hypothetical protein